MGLLATQVCTSHERHTHSGTNTTEETIKHAVTDDAIRFLDEKSEKLKDGIQALTRHSNPFLKEVILTLEYCTVNRWFYMRYLFSVHGSRFSGRFEKKTGTAKELDDHYTEEAINRELAEIMCRRVLTPIVCPQFAREKFTMDGGRS